MEAGVEGLGEEGRGEGEGNRGRKKERKRGGKS